MAVHSLSTVSDSYAFYNKANGKSAQQNKMTNSEYDEREKAHSDKINKMRSLIRGADKENANKPKSILESTRSYGDSIRASRTNTKSTANEIKKLKYNFKNISSQIRRSKTSVSAKQVASKARREVVQLKAKLQTGKYDKEELEAAIEHAKSMERAAKKKARHLEEEELIKITDKADGTGLIASQLEEDLENKTDEAIEELEEEIEEEIEESVEEATEEMYDLLAESMEDMMEDTLENLMDGMMTVTDFEMSEDEFKMFKIKHRASEDKAMLEADAKYLKAIFDNMDKKMNSGGGINIGAEAVSFNPVSMDSGLNVPNIVDISV